MRLSVAEHVIQIISLRLSGAKYNIQSLIRMSKSTSVLPKADAYIRLSSHKLFVAIMPNTLQSHSLYSKHPPADSSN